MKLIKMRCSHDNLVIVNLDELRNAPRLQGAYIFKRLMCIEESEFKSQSLNKDLFKDFNISNRDWMDFIGFIRNGRIKNEISSNEIHDENERKKYQKLFIQNLDDISNKGIFLKFGPFPIFDEYIEWTINNQKNMKTNTKKENANNPMIPEQDILHLYKWKVVFTNNMTEPWMVNWDVTINVKNTTSTFYVRQLRIPEQD